MHHETNGKNTVITKKQEPESPDALITVIGDGPNRFSEIGCTSTGKMTWSFTAPPTSIPTWEKSSMSVANILATTISLNHNLLDVNIERSVQFTVETRTVPT